MTQKFFLQMATFFGVGRLPKAPGTWGSLAALPLAWLLQTISPVFYLGFCLVLLPLSVIACNVYETSQETHDCSEIVIDEVVGMLLALAWLPFGVVTVVAGFLLFRFFDVLKPFPISLLDRRVQGGFGVMIDDIVAGLIVNLILQIVNMKTTWLTGGVFA